MKTPDGKFANEYTFLTSWARKLIGINGYPVSAESTLEAIAQGLEDDIARGFESAAGTLRSGCREHDPRWEPKFAGKRAALGVKIRNEILDCVDRIKAIREADRG